VHYIDIRDVSLVAEVVGTSSHCQDKAQLTRATRGCGRVLWRDKYGRTVPLPGLYIILYNFINNLFIIKSNDRMSDWAHSIPLCHALSLSLSLSSLSWTSHAACAVAIAGVRQ